MSLTRKLTGAALATALTAGSLAGQSICEEPLPPVDDPQFQQVLYENAAQCSAGILAAMDSYVPGGARVVFVHEGLRHTLQVSPNHIDIHFRQDGTIGDNSRGYVRKTTREDAVGAKYLVSLTDGNNGLVALEEIPEIAANIYPPDAFTYLEGGQEGDGQAHPAFADTVFARALNAVRDFYNSNRGN